MEGSGQEQGRTWVLDPGRPRGEDWGTGSAPVPGASGTSGRPAADHPHDTGIGDHVTRPTTSRAAGIVATAVLLVLLAAPSLVLATEPGPDDVPTVQPHSTEAPTDGEVVYDGPFIDPTPDVTPESTDGDANLGAPQRAVVTPPATDALDGGPDRVPGVGVELLLLAVAGLSPIILLAGRVPAARRS